MKIINLYILQKTHSPLQYCFFFFLKNRPPPKSSLFPYPTLFRSKPIRQVELAGDSGDLYPRITQLEEPLLEDHTQDFVAQQPRRALLAQRRPEQIAARASQEFPLARDLREDRKSTRLNSSHGYISYAVFCLKKKIKE